MKTLKFKTNINCQGCIDKVKPFLDKEEGVKDWEVDIANPNKTLTVKTEALSPDDVVKIVNKAGFKAEEKSKGLFSKIFK